jgi:hypothetical protein
LTAASKIERRTQGKEYRYGNFCSTEFQNYVKEPRHWWLGELGCEYAVIVNSVVMQEVSRITSPSDSSEVKLRKIYARVQQIRDLSMEVAKSEKEAKQENIKKNSNVEDMLHHQQSLAAHQIEHLQQLRAQLLGRNDGRPTFAYILLNCGESCFRISSTIVRIGRSGWSLRTRRSGEM